MKNLNKIAPSLCYRECVEIRKVNNHTQTLVVWTTIKLE